MSEGRMTRPEVLEHIEQILSEGGSCSGIDRAELVVDENGKQRMTRNIRRTRQFDRTGAPVFEFEAGEHE